MSGIITSFTLAALYRNAGLYRHYIPEAAGKDAEGRMLVRLLKPSSAFRQPKGRKIAPKEQQVRFVSPLHVEGDHERNLNAERRSWKREMEADARTWINKPRKAELDRKAAIAEEIEHARQVKDLEVISLEILLDGTHPNEYVPDHGQSLLVDGAYSTATPSHPNVPMGALHIGIEHDTTRLKEAHEMMNHSTKKDQSLVTTRSGSSRKKGSPPRLKAEPQGELRTGSELLARMWGQPEPQRQTLAPDPSANAKDWTIEDALEDRRMYLAGC